MRITLEQAREIAQDAMDNAGYNILQYAGYYTIWSSEEGDDVNYAVAINKEKFDEGNGNINEYFAAYYSIYPDGEGWWEYTSELDVDELTEMLMQAAINIEIEEMKTRGLVV